MQQSSTLRARGTWGAVSAYPGLTYQRTQQMLACICNAAAELMPRLVPFECPSHTLWVTQQWQERSN